MYHIYSQHRIETRRTFLATMRKLIYISCKNLRLALRLKLLINIVFIVIYPFKMFCLYYHINFLNATIFLLFIKQNYISTKMVILALHF